MHGQCNEYSHIWGSLTESCIPGLKPKISCMLVMMYPVNSNKGILLISVQTWEREILIMLRESTGQHIVCPAAPSICRSDAN